MTRTVWRVFPVWSFEKEEKWLNEMSAKGLQLCEVGFCWYTFEEGVPGEYIYRLEMLDNMPEHAESEQYINFIEETGAEKIGTLLRWVYFRKKADGIGFDLFSDIDSRIRHLNRILVLAGILAAMQLIVGGNGLRIALLAVRPDAFPLITSILCLSVGVLVTCGFLRIFIKRQQLRKEKILHE